MDNQIPNIPDDSPNNQTPETDLFTEGFSGILKKTRIGSLKMQLEDYSLQNWFRL